MGGLFGGAPKAAPPPVPTPPAPMPDQDSPAVLAAKRRKLAESAATTGRASTILTAPQGLGSGTDYGSTTLGGR